jgi:hypothetical protein
VLQSQRKLVCRFYIADVASIYFPDKDIDADTVRFQLRPLIQKELDK